MNGLPATTYQRGAYGLPAPYVYARNYHHYPGHWREFVDAFGVANWWTASIRSHIDYRRTGPGDYDKRVVWRDSITGANDASSASHAPVRINNHWALSPGAYWASINDFKIATSNNSARTVCWVIDNWDESGMDNSSSALWHAVDAATQYWSVYYFKNYDDITFYLNGSGHGWWNVRPWPSFQVCFWICDRFNTLGNGTSYHHFACNTGQTGAKWYKIYQDLATYDYNHQLCAFKGLTYDVLDVLYWPRCLTWSEISNVVSFFWSYYADIR